MAGYVKFQVGPNVIAIARGVESVLGAVSLEFQGSGDMFQNASQFYVVENTTVASNYTWTNAKSDLRYDVFIPAGIASIADECFSHACLISQAHPTITVGGNCVIGDNAFSYALISTFICNGTVQSVGQYAFQDCVHLTQCLLGGARTVGRRAFYECKELQRVELSDDWVSPNYDGLFFGCEKLEQFSPSNKINGIGYSTFFKCNRLDELEFGDINLDTYSNVNTFIVTEFNIQGKEYIDGCLVTRIRNFREFQRVNASYWINVWKRYVIEVGGELYVADRVNNEFKQVGLYDYGDIAIKTSEGIKYIKLVDVNDSSSSGVYIKIDNDIKAIKK